MIRVFALAAFVVVAAPVVAGAADLDAPAVGAGMAGPGLWRGHFSGGTNYDPPAQDIALAWTDEVAYFPDLGGCRRWVRDRRAQVRPYQGYTGCLRIR